MLAGVAPAVLAQEAGGELRVCVFDVRDASELEGAEVRASGPDASSDVESTDPDGCALLDLSTTTGIDDAGELPEHLEAGAPYPNPTSGRAAIPVSVARGQELTVVVFDVTGRRVFHGVSRMLQPGTFEMDVDLSGLASGIYFVRLQGEGTTTGGPLVKLGAASGGPVAVDVRAVAPAVHADGRYTRARNAGDTPAAGPAEHRDGARARLARAAPSNGTQLAASMATPASDTVRTKPEAETVRSEPAVSARLGVATDSVRVEVSMPGFDPAVDYVVLADDARSDVYLRPLGEMPAFPGAVGFGAYTPGGRGGEVLIVTSLADYDPAESEIPGTLRWAVNQPYPRTILFEVAGEISLKAPLWIGGTPLDAPPGDNPHSFLTIAGQSAPGEGITLSNYALSLINDVHDVVIQHLRVRNASMYQSSVHGSQVGDGFALQGAHDVVLDHVSCSWATDECISMEGTTNRPIKNVTVQNSIAAEGLLNGGHVSGGPHSRCMIASEEATNISIHHNYMASCNRRHPQIGGTSPLGGSTPPVVDVRYNLAYNFGKMGITFGGQTEGPLVNVVGNVVRFGPGTTAQKPMENVDREQVGTLVYLEDNCEIRRAGGLDTATCPANQADLVEGTFFSTASTAFRAPPAGRGVSDPSADGLAAHILANAGALPHDAHDRKFVADYEGYAGDMGGPCRDDVDNDCHDEMVVTPPNGGLPLPDGDRDGIPDEFDARPDSFSAWEDTDGDGWSDLEAYLNPPSPSEVEDERGISYALSTERFQETGSLSSYLAHPSDLPAPTALMAYGNVITWRNDLEHQIELLRDYVIEDGAANGVTGLIYTPTLPYSEEMEQALADGDLPPLDVLARRPWVSEDEPGFLGMLEAQRDEIAKLVDEGMIDHVILRPFQEAGGGFHSNTGLTPESYAELTEWVVNDLYAELPVTDVIVHWNTIEGLDQAIPDLDDPTIEIYSGVTIAMPSHGAMVSIELCQQGHADACGMDFATQSWETAGVRTWIAEFKVAKDGRVDPITGWVATGLSEPDVIPEYLEHYRNMRQTGYVGGITWANSDALEDWGTGDPWDADDTHPDVRAWWIEEVAAENGYDL